MTASRILLSTALIAAIGLTAACGRKAPLDSPYEANQQARKDAERNKEPLPEEMPKPDNNKPFILDPLL